VTTSTGHLHVLGEGGDHLLKQRVHNSAVVSVRVRPAGAGLDPNNGAEDITLVCRDAVFQLAALEVLPPFG
jgi:hypothetical protein